MVKRIGTIRRKTRDKYKVYYRERGKVPLSRYFAEFTTGDKVNLITHGVVEMGRFHPRFHGLTGTITGEKKGACYEVVIHDQNKEKSLFIHPIHLSK